MSQGHRWLRAIAAATLFAAVPLFAQTPEKTAPGFTLKTLDGVGADGVVHGVNPGPIDQAALQQHLSEILPSR